MTDYPIDWAPLDPAIIEAASSVTMNHEPTGVEVSVEFHTLDLVLYYRFGLDTDTLRPLLVIFAGTGRPDDCEQLRVHSSFLRRADGELTTDYGNPEEFLRAASAGAVNLSQMTAASNTAKRLEALGNLLHARASH